MKGNNGQSLLEVVFSIGLITLVMTGIVALLISSVSSRTKSYDRNKAVELSQIVMENMIRDEKEDSTNFWDLNSNYWTNLGLTNTDANFADYNYSVNAIRYVGNGCSAAVTECVNATITIRWKNGNTTDQFNRFFSRK